MMRTPNTIRWFFELKEYILWAEDKTGGSQNLQCIGMRETLPLDILLTVKLTLAIPLAGSGKTVLAYVISPRVDVLSVIVCIDRR